MSLPMVGAGPSAVSSGEFSPDDLAGLLLWVKSDTGTYQDDAMTTPATGDGDAVGGWEDQSGNGNHLTQSGANKPELDLNQINSLPAVYLANEGEYLGRADALGFTGNPAISVFIVAKDAETGSASGRFFQLGANDGAAGEVVGLSPEGGASYRYNNGNQAFSGADWASWSYSAWIRAAGADYGSGEYWHNGISMAETGTGSPTNTPSLANEECITAGRSNAGAAILGLEGWIAEIIVYNSALSAANRQSVEAYLAARYGI